MSTETGWARTSGQLLANRYMLETAVEPSDVPFDHDAAFPDRPQNWRGVDTVLNRPVFIQLRSRHATSSLEAAIAAGRVRHPNIVGIYDAACIDDYSYVVTEWVDGPSLTTLLTDGPLEPEVAANLVRQAAQAVATLHSHGIAHGDLSPDSVRITADGDVKLSIPVAGSVRMSVPRARGAAAETGSRDRVDGDASAEAHDQAVSDDSDDPDDPGNPTGASRGAAVDAADADLHGLGALLYIGLTGRAPSDFDPDALPTSPHEHGRLMAPRQLRAAVPHALSTTTMRALGADGMSPPTAGGLALELGRHTEDPYDEPPTLGGDYDNPWTGGDERSLSRWRRVALWTAVAVLVITIGFLIGVWRGAIPAPRPLAPLQNNNAATPSPSSNPSATKKLAVASTTLLDPSPNSDHTEGGGIGAATDDSTSTTWDTDSYNSAGFGKLKAGMGVALDLGSAHKVSSVTIDIADPGATVQLLRGGSGDAAPAADPSAYTSVQTVTNAATTITITPDASARYWAVWITELPRAGNGYQARVSDIRFVGR